MFGGLPSIDKLLTVLDRYDWMPGVMNTKQDDINFLNIAFFFLSIFSHFTSSDLQYHLSFTIDCVSALLNWVSETKVPAEKWYCINFDRVLYACNYEDKPIWLGLGSELSCSVNKGSLKKPYPVKS